MRDLTASRFLYIPPEIREQIYGYILHPDANRLYNTKDCTDYYSYKNALVLFRLNRQIYVEARKVFRDLNTFILVETPWPEAQNHVAQEGHVPLIAKGERASRFSGHRMTVSIDAQEQPMLNGDENRFLLLLPDLEKFTTMWFYSNLSHPGLNPQLRLDLSLRDPFTPDWEEKRMQKALQRQLLLPFGMIKNIRSVTVTGDPKPLPSVEAELREVQAIPLKTPEQCLRETIQLKLDGNSALGKGNFRQALELYDKAWLAMHVVIIGRMRHIHGDAFFGRELREEPFIGKNGQQERLILRVQLVANTCQVYLKLEDYEQCAFWGMRSISMLRLAMGVDEGRDIPAEDEAVLGFPAANEMGKIYYRTAVAKKALDDKAEARKLLRVAVIYLPRDEGVKREVAACALRLG
ncbi:hypothetical protein LTR36_001844 [Oleoguttula mirabilis]|uniref:Uncharacterized protein n=1 Tax=Oleoguttula mirabilis TaxID=1507867 RepID=A0AAV9JMQ0_9PEZI|nr:hypothetical protein LTR36_001844 [Oleoguttula mirabilis]